MLIQFSLVLIKQFDDEILDSSSINSIIFLKQSFINGYKCFFKVQLGQLKLIEGKIDNQRQLQRCSFLIQFNGAQISSVRSDIFVGNYQNSSPLRDLIYKVSASEGHAYTLYQKSMIVEFLQIYEINRIRLWIYDLDARLQNFQVFAVAQDRVTETLIYGFIYGSHIITIKFPDIMVSKLRFYNRGGNTINSLLAFFKIQAYYAF